MIQALRKCNITAYKSLVCSYGLATDGQKKRQYYLAYTLCFIILFLLVFVWFWSKGKTFIWTEDGVRQHFVALFYYGKYLRKIIRALLHGKLILPEWDFALGEGSDILQTLHYYVMGDPLTLLSAFVPSAYTWCLYNALVVLRMYLSGITFSVFCFETGQKKRLAVLSGSLVYVFCYWAIYNAARHTFFLTPMIYFPLVLSGVEKIIKGKSPWLFTSAVFLAAISQFYFFYMIVLLTVVYVIARLIPILRTNSKTAFIRLSQITFYAVIGAMLSAIITLPVLYSFMNSARMEVETPYFILYPLYYYASLPGLFLSSKSPYWLCMGYSAIALPSLLLLFIKRKKNVFVKVFFLIGVFIILCPFLGKALNGFSYHSNRWSWAFALVCAYAVTTTWEDMFNLSMHEMRYLCCVLAIYLFACLIYLFACLLLKKPSHGAEAMANICIALLIAVVLVLHSTRVLGMRAVHVQLLVLFLAGTSIVSHGYWKHAPSAGNYASQGLAVKNVSSITQPSETEAVKMAAKKYEKKLALKEISIVIQGKCYPIIPVHMQVCTLRAFFGAFPIHTQRIFVKS